MMSQEIMSQRLLPSEDDSSQKSQRLLSKVTPEKKDGTENGLSSSNEDTMLQIQEFFLEKQKEEVEDSTTSVSKNEDTLDFFGSVEDMVESQPSNKRLKMSGVKKKKQEDRRLVLPKWCVSCGSHGVHCHDRVHGQFCLKAVYAYVNRLKGSACHTNAKAIYRKAYNESRWVRYQERFGYYEMVEKDVPMCMENGTRRRAIHLLENMVLAAKLHDENENGKKKYLKSKKDRLV